MIPAALYVLATVDGAFCGFRAAAGRNGAIDKRKYFARASMVGLFVAQIPLLLIGASVAINLWLAPDGRALYDEYVRAGERLVWVYGPYATATLAALFVWASPTSDVRSLMTVVILGPFTLIRPLVIAGGIVAGAVGNPPAAVLISLAVAGATMLSLQPALDWWQQRRQPAPITTARL